MKTSILPVRSVLGSISAFAISLTLMSVGASLIPSPAFAEGDKVAAALTTKLDGTSFQAQLKEGFHFNEAAPNQVTVDGRGLKPKTSKPRQLDFEFVNAKFTTGRASLYVCDDALTFCEPKLIEFHSDASNVASAANATNESTPKKAVTKNEFGFIEDNLEAAAAQALKEKKLVLIDFSARWCPGCVRLENEIFGTKAFRTAAKKFVKVRLDYDRFENLKIAKQYNIHAIPSLLVTTTSLEEISRAVDFQPMPVIAKFLDDARSNPLPFPQLQAKAVKGDQAAVLALGVRLYAGSQFAKSVEYLSKAKTAPVELADARVQAAKEAADKDEKLKPEFQKVVREAIEKEPSSSRSIVWRTLLAESLSDGAEKKKIGLEGLAVGDVILAHPARLKEAMKGDAIGEFAGYERMYVASERADLAESAGLDEAAQQAALVKVTELGRELKIPVERKGPSLRYLIFLMAAKQFPEAEAQAQAMLKQDPLNPEILRRLLKVLNNLKKYDEAVRVGREILPQSFGKNEVWVAQQLAKAYIGAGQKLEAKALAQAFLARTDIDWSLMKSENKDLTEVAKSIN